VIKDDKEIGSDRLILEQQRRAEQLANLSNCPKNELKMLSQLDPTGHY
jgi:hypothetical protein